VRKKLTAANSVLWTTVSAGSVTIDVYLVDRATVPDMQKHEGLYLKTECIFLIGWDLPNDLAELTLLHELEHARLHIGGIPCGSADEEESHVSRFSAAVYDSLKRNGLLVFPERPALPHGAR
jgi:Zn-dependent peptidase ImmA (M78 family)